MYTKKGEKSMIFEIQNITPLSTSRLDMPTVQTDFKTNQLTLDQSEAELRAKVAEIIINFNDLNVNIGGILDSIDKEIGSIVNKKLDEMLKSGALAELVNGEIVKSKQDKNDSSLTTDNKTVVGAITEVQDLAKSKSKIMVQDEIASFSRDITFEIVDPRDGLEIIQVNPSMKLKEVE